ncbi:MAG: hypothetical protein EBU93_02835 [Chlamydiae bacterium]|nr:hypothetical protein [Chlamydiota bacterium]
MSDIWNQIKTVIFHRSFFKVPFWIWFGPGCMLGLSALMNHFQPHMIPLALFACLVGTFLSAAYKIKGVGIASSFLVLTSLIFHKNMIEPQATYWLYVFGLITSFLIVAYSIEEYESFIFSQAEEAKKNSEEVKLWQSRFEGNQLRLEREKERLDKILGDFENQEETYLQKIDQLEKMFHSSTYELKQEQNRGYQLHKELKLLLIERYENQNQIAKLHQEIQQNQHGLEEKIDEKNREIALLEEKVFDLTQTKLHLEAKVEILETKSVVEEQIEPVQEITPQMIIEEAVVQQLLDIKVETEKIEPKDEEENIYFSSF